MLPFMISTHCIIHNMLNLSWLAWHLLSNTSFHISEMWILSLNTAIYSNKYLGLGDCWSHAFTSYICCATHTHTHVARWEATRLLFPKWCSKCYAASCATCSTQHVEKETSLCENMAFEIFTSLQHTYILTLLLLVHVQVSKFLFE